MGAKMKSINNENRLAQRERDGFVDRLQQALHLVGYLHIRASEFARQYEGRSSHRASPQSVRKWLNAETMPRQHHIVCLARWLNCEPVWLRYGSDREGSASDQEMSLEEIEMLTDFASLDSRQKYMVKELVSIMLVRMQ